MRTDIDDLSVIYESIVTQNFIIDMDPKLLYNECIIELNKLQHNGIINESVVYESWDAFLNWVFYAINPMQIASDFTVFYTQHLPLIYSNIINLLYIGAGVAIAVKVIGWVISALAKALIKSPNLRKKVMEDLAKDDPEAQRILDNLNDKKASSTAKQELLDYMNKKYAVEMDKNPKLKGKVFWGNILQKVGSVMFSTAGTVLSAIAAMTFFANMMKWMVKYPTIDPTYDKLNDIGNKGTPIVRQDFPNNPNVTPTPMVKTAFWPATENTSRGME